MNTVSGDRFRRGPPSSVFPVPMEGIAYPKSHSSAVAAVPDQKAPHLQGKNPHLQGKNPHLQERKSYLSVAPDGMPLLAGKISASSPPVNIAHRQHYLHHAVQHRDCLSVTCRTRAESTKS